MAINQEPSTSHLEIDILRQQSSLTPDMLNEAMLSYVETMSNRTRLSEHLAGTGLQALEDDVLTELSSVLESASARLWKDAGTIVWDSDYEQSFVEHLERLHPWLNAESLSRIIGYSNWLCWHEGLFAK